MRPNPDTSRPSSDTQDLIVVRAARGATRGTLHFGALRFPCALGRSGIVSEKREGDGGTPAGLWPLRDLRYRPDRVTAPETCLASAPTVENDGWCDAPGDSAYNLFVTRPYPASSETLWREDHLYDIVVMLGYNDAPVIDGAGSAIFFHLAKEKEGLLQPTEGCVALALDDMRAVLTKVTPHTHMQIEFSDVD
tara:strand:+ start:13568 stop:14146 length:579 start_codon:yes stop_codon:yes gene_type:complete